MKNLKLSFALIVAVLAVGITVATKASFGKRVISACFTQLTLQDVSGTTVALNVSPNRTCVDARSQISTRPIVNSAVVGTAFPSSASCPAQSFFCCAKVTEIVDVNDPLYSAAPLIDLGEGLKKYKIASTADIFCKLNQ